MISKASELVEVFIKEETRKLAEFNMPHMPTLGSAYEEVTKQAIDRDFIIPKSLELKVVSGFISIGDEMLPEQIDCMLVYGDGKKYGLLEQYIYDIEKVLCIFEVKKTLRKNDYIDAFDHLGKVRRMFAEYFENKIKNEAYEPDISAARNLFAKITGNEAPSSYKDINRLSETDGILFYSLVQESLAPITIIHGYGGYKSERGLRTAFIELLEGKNKISGVGLGIPSIPSLVTSNQFCLVKGNGLPFLAIKDKDEWVAVLSTCHNSARVILELIWSKISFFFKIEMPWNDDLYIENVKPLMLARAVKEGDKSGWMYEAIELKGKDLKRMDNACWKPEKLEKAEMSAIYSMLANGGIFSSQDESDVEFEEEYGITFDELSNNLIKTRCFMRNGGYIKPTNQVTHVISNDDETGYVSYERNKLDLWCRKNNIPTNYINLIILD